MEEILKKLEEQERKLDAIYVSAEKTRKYFLYTLVLSLVFFLLPLLGLLFAIPFFLDTLTSLTTLPV
ncbi:MAG: hypothetical protein A2808_00775 [Candidatus Moranbacteria bacterium RIFCSPHIGHO2_01_FULL_55_24]|nr:MAG: hypothetical protein A2808_00775 [Candidatus Moranbacteria bacterium RIFCSPHIGHO2_01_FULL_55_24]